MGHEVTRSGRDGIINFKIKCSKSARAPPRRRRLRCSRRPPARFDHEAGPNYVYIHLISIAVVDWPTPVNMHWDIASCELSMFSLFHGARYLVDAYVLKAKQPGDAPRILMSAETTHATL